MWVKRALQVAKDGFACDLFVSGDHANDGRNGSGTHGFVGRNGERLAGRTLGAKDDVASDLAIFVVIPKSDQVIGKFSAVDVARSFQATASTCSR